MNIFEQYDERIRKLETILDADKPVKLRQAHITSTSPLAVKYSGETASHPIQNAATGAYAAGDHVLVAIQSGAAYLLGALGKPPPTPFTASKGPTHPAVSGYTGSGFWVSEIVVPAKPWAQNIQATGFMYAKAVSGTWDLGLTTGGTIVSAEFRARYITDGSTAFVAGGWSIPAGTGVTVRMGVRREDAGSISTYGTGDSYAFGRLNVIASPAV